MCRLVRYLKRFFEDSNNNLEASIEVYDRHRHDLRKACALFFLEQSGYFERALDALYRLIATMG